MQIDKTDLTKKSIVIAGAIGVTVAAPIVAPYILPFLTPFLVDIGKVGLETVKGVGSNALWDMRSSFQPSHENEDLTRLLANAYSKSIADVLNQNSDNDLIRYILPGIKDEIDGNLKTGKAIDLLKLFPKEENLLEIELDGQKKLPFYKRLFGKERIDYHSVDNVLLANVTSEDFILKLSDDSELAKKVISEEVEITLRRWFVQLNPKLADKYTFPPSLDKTVFEKIGELIPQKINELVKTNELSLSWTAFQRSHLQAILRQVNNLQNGFSDDDRKLLRPLGEFLDKLSQNNELIERLVEGTSAILSRIGESEENLKKYIAEESKKLEKWLDSRLEQLVDVSQDTNQRVKFIEEEIRKAIVPEKEGTELNLISLPNLTDKIYGRNVEIKEILRFIKEEDKHGAIVLPTCYGKTSLIKKFLHKTTDKTEVKPEFRQLFEKVVYIFCYQNQNFQQIIQPFASLQGKYLEYTEGKEVSFLKEKIFDALQHKKILLIIDNFESWVDENDKYLNDGVRIFLETLFGSNHQIRTLFVSQRLPHTEKDFRKKTDEIKAIERALLKGLDEKSAFDLVRTEGDKEDFKYVSDAELIQFFQRVHYIPQAIQSMLAFIDDEAISFQDLMTEFWTVFEEAESNETDLEKQIPKELRPTRALLKYQIGKLDEYAKHLLSLTAFFNSPVPEELLLNDFGDFQKAQLRKPLDRLEKHKLLLIQTDRMTEKDESTRAIRPIHYYELHGFVKDVVNKTFHNFAIQNEAHLISLADQMDDKQGDSWEKKLFDKQLALVECWEDLENHLVNNRKITERQYFLDLIDFKKALALQETISGSKKLNEDELKQRVGNVEKLYLRWLEKYPNDADAYNNLGILLNNAGRTEEAEKSYLKAIELNPNYAEAYGNLAWLLASRKNEANKEEIYKNLEECLKIRSYDKEMLKNWKVFDWLRDDERFREMFGE